MIENLSRKINVQQGCARLLRQAETQLGPCKCSQAPRTCLALSVCPWADTPVTHSGHEAHTMVAVPVWFSSRFMLQLARRGEFLQLRTSLVQAWQRTARSYPPRGTSSLVPVLHMTSSTMAADGYLGVLQSCQKVLQGLLSCAEFVS